MWMECSLFWKRGSCKWKMVVCVYLFVQLIRKQYFGIRPGIEWCSSWDWSCGVRIRPPIYWKLYWWTDKQWKFTFLSNIFQGGVSRSTTQALLKNIEPSISMSVLREFYQVRYLNNFFSILHVLGTLHPIEQKYSSGTYSNLILDSSSKL